MRGVELGVAVKGELVGRGRTRADSGLDRRGGGGLNVFSTRPEKMHVE